MENNLRQSYLDFIKRLKQGRGFWENGVIQNSDAKVKEKIKELKELL